LLAQMVRVAEKFVDLAGYVLRQAPDRTGAAPAMARTGNEFVVYVHGISRHVAGYSLPWWNALSPNLSRPIGRHEVLWSSVVNPRGVRSAPRARSIEEEEFAQELEMILEDRQQQLLSLAPEASRDVAPAPMASVRGADFSIDDFTRYMLNEDEREAILKIFDDKVRPLLRDGATVHVVSHSWGTVVAWEGLRRLDTEPLAGRVATLFVVGSALSIGPVQSNLRTRIPNGKSPLHVDQLFNLDARGDIVGGSIRHKFDVDQEFLGLEAPGCSLFNPGCAHSSYFRADNLAVNRDIFARLIGQ
jgi:pimeloyl-ACP methyl ester carboxylesterase